MARPTTKAALTGAARAQYDKLAALIDGMTESERHAAFPFDDRDKNTRDVLVHLYEWHRLLIDWAEANLAGRARPFLPEPYNWRTYPQMNVGFWEKHQATPYDRARAMLIESHGLALALIERFTDEELFTKNHFAWTGGSTLGSYCVSATSAHYDWAMKKLKQHLKLTRAGNGQ